MGSFSRSQQGSVGNESAGGSSYSKIFAIFHSVEDHASSNRKAAVNVSFKTTTGYRGAVQQTEPSGYRNIAGTDLSSIFFPFESNIGQSGTQLPCFDSSVNSSGVTPSGAHHPNILDILPFQFNPIPATQGGIVYDTYVFPSGDSFKDTLSGNYYTGDVNRYRNTNLTRGIGFRLPAMGVGWGYTTFGTPWPSGATTSGVAPFDDLPSGTILFKGNVRHGYEVDPADYVAAPIDFRYDTTNNVWTAPKPLLVQVLGQSGVAPRQPYATSGCVYSWQEMYVGGSGFIIVKPSGYTGTLNAYELNGISVPYGTITKIEAEGPNIYTFKYDFPIGKGKYKVLMLVDDVAPSRAIWDYPRFSSDDS